MHITITIDRQDIFAQLARTTGYIGSKKIDSDDSAYLRISLTEGDAKIVERFWSESRDALCLVLRRQIVAEGLEDNTYRLDMAMSEAFDTSLRDTLSASIANYFVQSMAAKWLAIAEPAQAPEYAATAAATLDFIARKSFAKRPPRRPTY